MKSVEPFFLAVSRCPSVGRVVAGVILPYKSRHPSVRVRQSGALLIEVKAPDTIQHLKVYSSDRDEVVDAIRRQAKKHGWNFTGVM